ncbi:MAG: hypothetical protein ACKO37_08355 [Vampirovibrionales bacterium]
MRVQQNFPVYALSKPSVFGAKTNSFAQVPQHTSPVQVTTSKFQATPPNAFQVYLTGTELMLKEGFQGCKAALSTNAARTAYSKPSQVSHGLTLQG